MPSLMIRVSRQRDGLQARRTKAIDRGPRHGHRQARANRGHASHVGSLRAFGIGTAHDTHPRSRQGRVTGSFLSTSRDAMRGQIIGPGQVERTAKALGQRRARAGDHDGFSHRFGSPTYELSRRRTKVRHRAVYGMEPKPPLLPARRQQVRAAHGELAWQASPSGRSPRMYRRGPRAKVLGIPENESGRLPAVR